MFSKDWHLSQIKGVRYFELSHENDRKINIDLCFKSRSACNKKNPIPRPKLTFKRIYGLKENFESVSTFFEVDETSFNDILTKINNINKNDSKRKKPHFLYKKRDGELIVFYGGVGILYFINSDDENFNELKSLILSLVK